MQTVERLHLLHLHVESYWPCCHLCAGPAATTSNMGPQRCQKWALSSENSPSGLRPDPPPGTGKPRNLMSKCPGKAPHWGSRGLWSYHLGCTTGPPTALPQGVPAYPRACLPHQPQPAPASRTAFSWRLTLRACSSSGGSILCDNRHMFTLSHTHLRPRRRVVAVPSKSLPAWDCKANPKLTSCTMLAVTPLPSPIFS